MAKSNYIVRGGGDFSGLYNEFNKAQKKMTAFQSGMTKAFKGLRTTIGVLAIGKLVKDSTLAAMGVESAMDNIARNMGESALSFKNWANTQSQALGMATADAFKYGSTFSNLLGSFSTSTEQTASETKKLMQAAAVISSKTGRTYEDTANRIRSGMLGSTEAIEDLGIYTQVSMLESTDAFKKFANGKSWAQLDFQTQQQIRLNAILEQSYKRYGDTLADTTQTRQAKFIASLNNIKLSLGQAFLPIWNSVLPALTNMANAIGRVINVFAQFTQALFGQAKQQTKATQAQAAAVGELGDETAAAGKKAKGAVAGFDEINQLSKGSDSDAGGLNTLSAEDTGLTSINDGTGGAMGSVSIKAAEMGAKVREVFENMKNVIVNNKNIIVPALGAIGGAFIALSISSGITSLIEMVKGLGIALKGLWIAISTNPIIAIITVIAALVGAFITAYQTNDEFRAKIDALWSSIQAALEPALQKVGETLTWVWNNVMVPAGQYIAGGFKVAWQILGDIAIWVWKNVLVPIGSFLLWLWNSVLVPVGRVLIDVLGSAFGFVADVALIFWQNVLVPLGKALSEMFGPAIEAISAVLTFLWQNVIKPVGEFLISVFKGQIQAIIDIFVFLWQNVLKPIATFIGGVFLAVFDTVTKSIGSIIGGLKTTFNGLMNFITGVFTGNWKKAWEGIKGIFKGVFESLWGIVKTPINLIIDGINMLIGGLNSIKFDVPDWVPLIGGKGFGINIPKIPKLAKGGITNGPTLAMVGDNPGGREVVSPLDGLLDMIVTAMSATNNNGNMNLTVKIGEDTVGEKIINYINDKTKITGESPILI